MNSRRKFIQAGGMAVAAMPLLSFDVRNQYDIDELKSSVTSEDYWQLVRTQFPLKTDQVYFNNGTMGPTPGYTLQKMWHHMQNYAIHAAEVDYKNDTGPELLTGYFEYKEIRERIGRLINAEYGEISLIQNATFGMNYVANGLDLKKGDEIINTDQEHGGGFAAWQLLAKRHKCIYKQAKITVPVHDPDTVLRAIFREVTHKTKVIAIPHIVSGYGTILPVREICQRARKMGIFTVIDGAQAVGQIAVDVKDLECDAYYSSLHKWLLAPAGSGILYIRGEKAPEIWSTIASYNWDNQNDHGFRLMQNGTGNPALMTGLEASLDFFETIGAQRWFGRIAELGRELRMGLEKMEHVKLLSSTTPGMTAGMVAYAVEGISGPQIQQYLWRDGKLQPRSVGQDYVRHCVHIYNSKKEIDRFLELMERLA